MRVSPAQSALPSRTGTVTTNPAGIWGRAPSFTSSSRSFSIATARSDPSAFLATASGWPPRSQLSVTVPVPRSTVRSAPEGSVNDSDVFTPTKAVLPATTVVVGSPSMSMLPSGFGARGSVMSMRPITPSGLSE